MHGQVGAEFPENGGSIFWVEFPTNHGGGLLETGVVETTYIA